MAKAKDNIVEPEDIEGLEQDSETTVIRPNDIAKELEVSPKAVRAFLRDKFTRPGESKNTNWELTEEMVEAVTARFTASDDEEETDEDSDES